MRKFNYRVPRFSVDLPVHLTFDESTQVGRCTEISTEGMKLEVREPLSPETSGTAHISYQGVTLDVAVRVAHSSSSHDGVRFVYESDEQRDEVSRLVEILAGPHSRSGPILHR
jgi:PilZ domain